MMRTQMVRDVGGFDTRCDTADDLDLFLRLARICEFGFIGETLLDYNIGNSRQQTRDTFRVFRSEWRCIQRHIGRGARLPRRERVAMRRNRARIFTPAFRERGWRALREADYMLAWRCYTQAVRLSPSVLWDAQVARDLLSLCKRSLIVSTGRGSKW